MSTTTKRVTELTVRGIILGILITLVFTAANVYLGLKVGLTFATSIPAAVISMAILSAFKDASILENNIVQTVASAAGTLSAIIFVLPGLVIVGWWTEFPFWTSFWICASGGVLGVLFTIPLRRAMVTTSDLPYPEGVAAAEVLEVGTQAREGSAESREGLLAVVYGSVASAGMAILVATRVAAGDWTKYFPFGKGVSGYDMSFSLALLGVGYLVGLSVGVAMLVGLLIAWAGAVPVLTALSPAPTMSMSEHALSQWTMHVRFIGAGTIGVAAIWTLTKLAGPVVRGVISTMSASRAAKDATDTRDVDLSPAWIVLLAIVCLVVIAYLLKIFLGTTPLVTETWQLIVAMLPFIFIGGFVVAAITGYMAGLIGASNSPISGVGILAIIICATLLIAVAQPAAEAKSALVAYALFATAIVFAIATISNNNLQDLKTGQLVGATPRAQQWALIIGVIAGAAVIPPVLNLLNQAYGFAGAPRLASAVAQPLPAPQASLISALAQGVIEQRLDWGMIGLGAGLGVLLVILDEFLGKLKWLRLPPLAVGLGIYLPMSATLPVVIGAFIGYIYDLWAARTKAPEHAKRLAVLVSSGMIVGESLFGVVLAGLIVVFSTEAPLGLVPANFAPAPYVGLLTFIALVVLLYGWIMHRSSR
ncbi:MAG: oligopeptide transporter, OPT family [Alphaproteobacteria bacterium]|nr:oligopeptide transporter, OPT family [Alphaproteobacteria bacterium]MDE2110923.1 oligopeptide transporter, OPT family [Alphaproteobacteria bacterium]MDE2495406.1 oligopeptide transporter, OPT family [Alphaproteobacteria bacterium]